MLPIDIELKCEQARKKLLPGRTERVIPWLTRDQNLSSL